MEVCLPSLVNIPDLCILHLFREVYFMSLAPILVESQRMQNQAKPCNLPSFSERVFGVFPLHSCSFHRDCYRHIVWYTNQRHLLTDVYEWLQCPCLHSYSSERNIRCLHDIPVPICGMCTICTLEKRRPRTVNCNRQIFDATWTAALQKQQR